MACRRPYAPPRMTSTAMMMPMIAATASVPLLLAATVPAGDRLDSGICRDQRYHPRRVTLESCRLRRGIFLGSLGLHGVEMNQPAAALLGHEKQEAKDCPVSQ